ncbi:hypothetical protein RDABS01_035285 [Bienertia sinuspersici]
MMVIDAIFLLQFLLFNVNLEGMQSQDKSYLSKFPRTTHLVDPSESAYHSILQDIFKFENQIPIFRQNHKIHTSFEASNNLIVDEHNNPSSQQKLDDKPAPMENKTQQKHLTDCLPTLNISLLKLIEMLSNIKLLRAISKPLTATWTLITAVTDVVPPLKQCTNPEEKGAGSSSLGESSNNIEAPTVDEIAIPLLKVGIEFCGTRDGPITNIWFDKRSMKLHLPVVRIDANTEVIIRKLVAYEAEAIVGPLYLARYTELMNGIIDTAEDVRLLRERKILVSYMSDEDVAQLWNGMSRSIRLSHVPSIDRVIIEVNEYFNSKRRVKFVRFTKECMLCGWRILVLFLTLVLIVLLIIQSFCDIYSCPRALGPVALPPGS